MAEKKGAMIVIKKINVVAGGAHGGAWKVAFADFMTAMMAFFLVMWLLATQSEQTKKAISDYFSTPSVIEYEFNNFGAELTLEKLFLDLINEPLKVFQAFINPADRTPNVMAMGMKKVVQAHLLAQLGAVAQNVEVTPDTVTFEIPDIHLFKAGTTMPAPTFVATMDRVKGITTGLQDSDVKVTSVVYNDGVYQDDPRVAKTVAEERLAVIELQIKGSFEHGSVSIQGESLNRPDRRGRGENLAATGFVKIEIKQRQFREDGKPTRQLEGGTMSREELDKRFTERFVDGVVNKRRSRRRE
jgi:chemotaxis protein MotB